MKTNLKILLVSCKNIRCVSMLNEKRKNNSINVFSHSQKQCTFNRTKTAIAFVKLVITHVQNNLVTNDD